MRAMPGWRTVLFTILLLPVAVGIMAPLAMLFAAFMYSLALLGMLRHLGAYLFPRRLA